MKKKSTNRGVIIIISVLAAFLIFTFVYERVASRTKEGAGDFQGNTSGNLYNMGLVCEYGDRIFFSNPNDEGILYSMNRDLSDCKKLCDDYAQYINCDEHYVFYSRMNNLKDKAAQSIFIFYSNGIFRIDHNGKNQKMLHSKPIGTLMMYANRLFYQHYAENEQLTLNSMKLDGEDDRILIKDDCKAVSMHGSDIIYSGTAADHGIHSCNILNGSEDIISDNSVYMPIAMDDGIYYISTFRDYRIYRMSYDGKEDECISELSASTYNISKDGRYIFFQCDDKESPGLYRINMVNNTAQKIADGYYKWINLTEEYCFFYDMQSEEAFVYHIPTGRLNGFTAPKLSK